MLSRICTTNVYRAGTTANHQSITDREYNDKKAIEEPHCCHNHELTVTDLNVEFVSNYKMSTGLPTTRVLLTHRTARTGY